MLNTGAIIADLETHLPVLKAKGDAGCSDSHVQWAMGDAILQALKAGYALTDLDWFKGTSYYTGDRGQEEKAA